MKRTNFLNNIFILLFFLSGIPSVYSQTTEYSDNTYGVFATSDSRLVATIREVGDEVRVEALAVGKVYFGTVTLCLTFDPAVVVPIKGPGGNDITSNLSGAANLGAYVKTNPNLPAPTFWQTTGLSGQVNVTSATKWTYITTGADNNNKVTVPEKEVLSLFTIHFRKLEGASLSNTTFAFYDKTTMPAMYSNLAHGASVNSGGSSNATRFVDANLFTFRVPSSVTTGTNPVVNGSSVTLTGIATSEGLAKRAGGKGVDWDNILETGFIYTKENVTLSIDEYSKKIKMNGTEYNFPAAEDITDNAFTLGGKTFYIKSTANSTAATSVNMSENLTGLSSGTYYAWAYMKYKFQTSNVYPAIGARESFNIVVCPETSSWIIAAADNNWNNASNWSNGVPGTCTAVTIKAGASHYPVLTSATGAKCNTIHFEHGAEVAGTHFLTYSSASVDMTIPNSRWHMVAPPLCNMYSGDYWLSESTVRRNPSVSMMKYQAVNPQYTSIPVQAGEWSNTFNTLDVQLAPGTGYATCINLNESGVAKNYTFSFPKTATTYDYYDRATGAVTGSVTGLSRTNSGKFIYEGVAGWNQSITDGSFDLPVADGTTENYNQVIVANPFMSHLDITKFYEANQSVLSGVFYLWSGDDGVSGVLPEVYTYQNSQIVSTSGTPLIIAPMQSFWAVRNASFTTLKVNAVMAVTSPGEVLRSALNHSNELRIEAKRGGIRNSTLVVRYDSNASNSYREGEDAETFFIANLDNKPAALSALVDRKALSINTLSDLSKEIALVISTSEKGWLTLEASGMESFTATGADWYLLDKWAGQKIRLSENASYSFENTTGNLEGRFALKAENAMTGLDNISNNTIGIYANAGIIHITSAENLKTVEVYNLQGQLLAKQTGLNTTATSLTVNQKGAVIVKVTTPNGQRVEKIRMD